MYTTWDQVAAAPEGCCYLIVLLLDRHNIAPDDMGPYIGLVNASGDEGKTFGKLTVSAFQRRQDRLCWRSEGVHHVEIWSHFAVVDKGAAT